MLQKLITLKIVVILMLAFTFDASASATAKASRAKSKYLLSYEQVLRLSKKDRNAYMKQVGKVLSELEPHINKRNKKSSASFIYQLLFDYAHAAKWRCIGGGVFVESGSTSCGVTDMLGFSCPAGKEICNPLIFGVQNDGRPVCHETATTNWCYKNTSPGRTTRLDLVFEKEGAAAEYAELMENIDSVCVNGDRSQIEESRAQVQRACGRLVRQREINAARAERGLLPSINSDGEVVDARVSTSNVEDGDGPYPHDVSDVPRSADFALYQYDTAGDGRCLPALTDDAEAVLARNGMDDYVGRPTSNEKRALATGIAQIERLLGSQIPRAWQARYKFVDAGGTWDQGISNPGFITVKTQAGHGGGRNYARYIHELGHHVGHTGSPTMYSRFERYRGANSCSLTTYCSDGRNERFAEAFAAFVVYPDLLKERCPAAFNFFNEEVFPNPSSRGAIAYCNGSPTGGDAGSAEEGVSR